jgi:hypothetical protein
VSRIFTTSFASVEPHYVTKVEKEGAHEARAAPGHGGADFRDKLVDELAKGKAMDRVLRA